ncbi:MAG: ankyrin repeat domain-containing protein, partial [Gemmatimonas sp.]
MLITAHASLRRRLSALLVALPVTIGSVSATYAPMRPHAPVAPVADAAMRADIAAVRALLRSGADVNAAQGDGMTALHWAAHRGDSTLAQLLLQARARVSATTRIGALTPLHLAAQNASAGVVRALLRANADVRVMTGDSVTVLHLAAMGGDTAIVGALLRAGAEINATEPAWGQTPLMVAAGRGRADAVKLLLTKGADWRRTARTVDPVASAAQDRQAKQKRNAVLAQLREQQGATTNPNWQPDSRQVQAAVKASRDVEREAANATVLASAAAATSAEEARLAAQGGSGLDDDTPGYNELLGHQGGHTALLLAVREGHQQTVRVLIGAGVDVNQTSAGDHTSPLLMAAINGQYDAAMQ